MSSVSPRRWRRENARAGITVNAICPGYINTEMAQAVPKEVLDKNIIPQILVARLGEPEEIARCAVFLAADESGLHHGIDAHGVWQAISRVIFVRHCEELLRRSNPAPYM